MSWNWTPSRPAFQPQKNSGFSLRVKVQVFIRHRWYTPRQQEASVSATTILTLAEPRPSSGSVTAIGVLAIISGGSTALGSLFLITSLLQPNSHFVLVSGWIIGALLLLLSAFGIAIVVGLLKR